uniref:Uncharacterized protein n=1 Tax=Anguilla anguilla TaxID=7936 RepID=A0A0E9Q4A6_ANGAN
MYIRTCMITKADILGIINLNPANGPPPLLSKHTLNVHIHSRAAIKTLSFQFYFPIQFTYNSR